MRLRGGKGALVYDLFISQDVSQRAIGDILGMNEQNVSLALKKIKKEIEKCVLFQKYVEEEIEIEPFSIDWITL